MEKVNAIEQKTLVIELTQGREMANQLKSQLDQVISPETCEALVEKILSTYDKALAMLTWKDLKAETLPEIGMLESPQPHSPVAGSPVSEVSNGVSKYQKCHKHVLKKRKISTKWSEQVRVCSKSGHDGSSLDDGHSWRKYGQKDILGANHPRAYYRCTHRNSRGCLATKQVQRSDEDSSIFEVTYKGNHSCIQAANSNLIIFSARKEISKPEKPESKATQVDKQIQPQQPPLLKVETDLMMSKEEIFPAFSFPFTGVESENLVSHFFCDAMKDNDMVDSCSPTFLSPTTSESNYFSSPSHINDMISQYDLNDMITTPTSIMNSPFGDLDFSIDQGDFAPIFSLDPIAYIS